MTKRPARRSRIDRLPPFLRPLATKVRGSFPPYNHRPQEPKPTWDAREEVCKKLSYGVEYVWTDEVEGDIAEFGTMTGQTAAAMARALSEVMGKHYRRHAPKKLFLFDSFVGLPASVSEVDRESPLVKTGVWGGGTCHGISKEELLKKCAGFLSPELVEIHDGWFSDTLPALPAATRFSLIHIDCDLYQSTVDVLDFVFSRAVVQEGTAIFFDDWNCNRASPALGERRAWAEAVEKYSVRYSDCGEYGVDGHKFIVHSFTGAKGS